MKHFRAPTSTEGRFVGRHDRHSLMFCTGDLSWVLSLVLVVVCQESFWGSRHLIELFLKFLVTNWRWEALHYSSTAGGIPQKVPCSISSLMSRKTEAFKQTPSLHMINTSFRREILFNHSLLTTWRLFLRGTPTVGIQDPSHKSFRSKALVKPLLCQGISWVSHGPIFP